MLADNGINITELYVGRSQTLNRIAEGQFTGSSSHAASAEICSSGIPAKTLDHIGPATIAALFARQGGIDRDSTDSLMATPPAAPLHKMLEESWIHEEQHEIQRLFGVEQYRAYRRSFVVMMS